MNYDFNKDKIEEILFMPTEIQEVDELLNDAEITLDTVYRKWITTLFIDIHNFFELFQEGNYDKLIKMIKIFRNEIVEIINDSDLIKDFGVRENYIYVKYATPKKYHIDEIFNKANIINNRIKMLNKLFIENNFSDFQVGIGIASSQELLIKQNFNDITSNIWIGDTMKQAAKLASLANKSFINDIGISQYTYYNLNDYNKSLCKEENFIEYNMNNSCYSINYVHDNLNNN